MTHTAWSPTDHPSRTVDPASTTPTAAIDHLVIVPRDPGPLVDVDATGLGAADEIDAAIDELFGAPTDESAGALDAVLVLGGIAVAGWSLVVGAPAIVLVGAVGSALLGMALPARAVSVASRERRRTAGRERAVGDGFALDASDPSVQALTTSYAACLTAAAKPGIPHGDAAVEAAHLAVVEVATLLGGGRPMADIEVQYVRTRTQAIGRLTLRLQRAQRRMVEARLEASIHRTPAQRERAAALTEARVELESSSGLSSLGRLETVGATIEREVTDAQR